VRAIHDIGFTDDAVEMEEIRCPRVDLLMCEGARLIEGLGAVDVAPRVVAYGQ
jgi:hypothetical protein